jgi:hypothetical protein
LYLSDEQAHDAHALSSGCRRLHAVQTGMSQGPELVRWSWHWSHVQRFFSAPHRHVAVHETPPAHPNGPVSRAVRCL